MKKILAVLAITLLLSSCNSNQDLIESGNSASVAVEEEASHQSINDNPSETEENSENPTTLMIQRDSNAATPLRVSFTDGDILQKHTVVHDIYEILWIVQRGGISFGEGIEAVATEIPAVEEADSLPLSNEDAYIYEDASGNGTWLRLHCEPYMPEEGVNEVPRKDIMMCVDRDNPLDAVLAIQNPTDTDKWTIYRLPEYGQWLGREIDRTLRMTVAM